MPVLTNVGATYDAIMASRELGIGFMDFTGINRVDMVVHVQKIGTGTQSWQAWNVTDNAEIGVINDAGLAVEKTLQATFDVTSKGWTGRKVVRIRAKSTVAADDPYYFGGACLGRYEG